MLNSNDLSILRSLGEKIARIAEHPVMDERRSSWKAEKALRGVRPMILAESGGVIDEVVPLSSLQCEGEWARGIERWLRDRIFHAESVGDDYVVEPRVYYGGVVTSSDFGVQTVYHKPETDGVLGSHVWDAPLKKLPEDIEKLHFREHVFDAEATLESKTTLESVFAGILAVENKSSYWWTLGLTNPAVGLYGLQELLMAFYDCPDGLHALMAFLRDDHLQTVDWLESNGLLTVNNEDDYIGSGSIGYTDLLPQSDYQPGSPARTRDMWVLSESQETVGVSPELFEEFIFPYQLPVAEKFGLSYYGCCEPIDSRWEVVKRLPNLRCVSISPWSDQTKMAANLGKDHVFCRKPNPALISTAWNEDTIRRDIRETLEITRGLNVEFAMKDVHTLCGEPWRLGRWVEIVREEMALAGCGETQGRIMV